MENIEVDPPSLALPPSLRYDGQVVSADRSAGRTADEGLITQYECESRNPPRSPFFGKGGRKARGCSYGSEFNR